MFDLVLIAIISALCIGEGTTTMSKEIINRLDQKLTHYGIITEGAIYTHDLRRCMNNRAIKDRSGGVRTWVTYLDKLATCMATA